MTVLGAPHGVRLGRGRPVEETARSVARRATDASDDSSGTLEDENGVLAW